MSDDNPFVDDTSTDTPSSYEDTIAASDYNEADLRPDGDTGGTWSDEEDGGEDLGDLRVNFSKQEAESESFVPLPAGKYNVKITSGSVKRSKSSKNLGKPYYNLEYTVQEGPHQGRKVFDNVMLFEGALYSLTQLLKALGYPVGQGSMAVPKLAELIGQGFVASVKVQPERTVDGKTYDPNNAVKGYFKLGSGSNAATTGGSNVDPLAP